MTSYIVTIGGQSWSRGPVHTASTITAARRMAEEYGNTADYAIITTPGGRIVAEHRRDPNGDGMTWYKAVICNGVQEA